EAWTTQAGEFVGNLAGYFNGNLGLDEYVFDSWSQATASTDANIAAAGAVTVLTLDHDSKAYIDSSALINQDTSLRSDQQDVIVKAISVNESVHFGGNLAMPGIYWNSKTSKLELSKGGFGSDANNAVGGSALIINYVNDVSAKIEDGVSLYADSLEVTADNKTMNIDVAASGGRAETFGFNGVGAWVFVDNTTTAQIESGANLVIGNNWVDGTTDSLVVNAEDTVDSINVLGGVAVSESIGAGASVGLNTVNRKTRAVIGSLDSEDSTAAVQIKSAGDVDVKAKNNGYIGSFSLASAVSTGGNGSNTTDASTADSNSFGIGVSGDVAINEISDTTEAYLNNVEWDLDRQVALAVSAVNESEILAIGGSVALVLGNLNQSTASVGLAGSYGHNTISQTTLAYVEDTTMT
ncbi:MAG: hypothetical protein AAFY72_19145, partial [Cyanobacteria bacterium J06649_4]